MFIHLLINLLGLCAPAFGEVTLEGKDMDTVVISEKSLNTEFKLAAVPEMKPKKNPKLLSSKGFHILLVEYSDMESSTTLAYGIKADGKLAWKIDLKGFNPSTPLFEKQYVYLASIGEVFKVRISDGKVMWNHSGLFENPSYKFNGLSEIKRQKNFIAFSQDVLVDDKTGKLDEVSK